MNNQSIAYSVALANPLFVEIKMSRVWNINKWTLSKRSLVSQLVEDMISRHKNHKVVVVLTSIARWGHHPSDVVVMALPVGTEIDCIGRQCWVFKS